MAKYLIERFGAGKYEVGSIAELSDGEAALYAAKIRKIELKAEPKLEVATPSRSKRKSK